MAGQDHKNNGKKGYPYAVDIKHIPHQPEQEELGLERRFVGRFKSGIGQLSADLHLMWDIEDALPDIRDEARRINTQDLPEPRVDLRPWVLHRSG